jgi:hypothetical protein
MPGGAALATADASGKADGKADENRLLHFFTGMFRLLRVPLCVCARARVFCAHAHVHAHIDMSFWRQVVRRLCTEWCPPKLQRMPRQATRTSLCGE